MTYIKNKIFTESYETCSDCHYHKEIIDSERGERICENCGFVIQSKIISHKAEWRSFDNVQNIRRCRIGAPMIGSYHDKGLSTIIDWKNKDYLGRKLSGQMRGQLYRLRKWQKRILVSDSKERNMIQAFTELRRISSILGISISLFIRGGFGIKKSISSVLTAGISGELSK